MFASCILNLDAQVEDIQGNRFTLTEPIVKKFQKLIPSITEEGRRANELWQSSGYNLKAISGEGLLCFSYKQSRVILMIISKGSGWANSGQVNAEEDRH